MGKRTSYNISENLAYEEDKSFTRNVVEAYNYVSGLGSGSDMLENTYEFQDFVEELNQQYDQAINYVTDAFFQAIEGLDC